MADAFMDKFNGLGERLKISGSGLSKRMSAGVTSMSGKMKELFQVSTPADRVVEDATAETLGAPDWVRNLHICDMVSHGELSGQDVVRAIKKRITNARSATIQLFSLFLLETCVKNCDKMFSEVASERLLDDMVKVIEDPNTARAVREKALNLIEAWGESTEELRYLPAFEETYKSLKCRGVQFPHRDAESLAPIFTPPTTYAPADSSTLKAVALSAEQSREIFDIARNSTELLSTVLTSSPQQEVLKEELTTTLVEQCRQSQLNMQRIIEGVGNNEVLLFEALNVNDGLVQLLSKYDEMLSLAVLPLEQSSEPALIPVGVVDEEESTVSSGGENSLVRKTSAKPSAFRTLQGEGINIEGNVRNKQGDDFIAF